MSSPARELLASINGTEVGILRSEANIWSFEYAATWVGSNAAFDLAPNLPRATGKTIDGSTQRPVQWFFDNLLPEEQARDVLAREASIDSGDAFSLLAYYGKESAGAITLLSRGEQPSEPGYRPLSDATLHDRISKLPGQSLSAEAPKHMSNAGAQHKLAVCILEGSLFEPAGSTPSTHLLKPDHVDTDTWPSTVANEYFVMRLAAKLGLNVPSVQIRYVPDPVYLVERFDREILGEQTQRLHIIDACQLLGVDRTFKYQQSTLDNLIRAIGYCENRARSRLSILEWVLFNVLTGNGDAHLKNLSFRVNPGGAIQLAPFYDLLSTECYRAAYGNHPRWPDRELSIPIGAAKTFGKVTRRDFLAFAGTLGVNVRAATRLVDRYTASIESFADELLAEFETIDIPEKTIRAAQARVLSQVRHIAIREMAQRLRE